MKINPSNKITPFIWLDTQAEEAANLYVSLFADSKIQQVARWAKGTPYPEGAVMSVTVVLANQEYILFNGGSYFKQDEAFSMFVLCEDQAETDRLWDALIANGGRPSQCGWLKDRFGVSWQIIPKVLMRLQDDPDGEKVGRVMQAMMEMVKIDVAGLERAAAG
jgi:predicted 3-demethylubiquinone-9 3-methyltransferase (glyoxalase superfamily)